MVTLFIFLKFYSWELTIIGVPSCSGFFLLCCRFRVLILLELMKMNRKAVRIFIYLPVLAKSRTRVGLAKWPWVRIDHAQSGSLPDVLFVFFSSFEVQNFCRFGEMACELFHLLSSRSLNSSQQSSYSGLTISGNVFLPFNKLDRVNFWPPYLMAHDHAWFLL